MLENPLTFNYDYGDNGSVVFTLMTYDADLAEAVVDDIQSICGSALERDQDYVYFIVDEVQVNGAIKELEATECGVGAPGYAALEG